MKPKPIAVTPGEPAGIGPDIALQLTQHTLPAPIVLLADRQLLRDRGSLLKLKGTFPEYSPESEEHPPISIWHIPLEKPCEPGRAEGDNAVAVINSIKQATAGCLSGQFSALTTGPINKAIIQDAGIPFTGHTELLAALTQSEQPIMVLANDQLKVALATTHIPLNRVSDALSRNGLTRCLKILHHDLKTKWGIPAPRILVCGLNPHAGESGHLGQEEITLIQPVIEACQREGIDVRGPYPADTAFTPTQRQTADIVLAMYHDQGLPVVKALGFGETVNVTLGLPIVRTSVDHGTAFDLAGTGRASES